MIASPPEEPIFLSRLSASLRIANRVRKALVIASAPVCSTNDDDDISYVTLYWTGSHISSIDVNMPELK